ncbi:MAG: DUF2911 domain-containing protein [Deltaproteobacteria bacterium]
MKKILVSVCMVLAFACTAFGQQSKKGIAAEGGDADDRGSARVLYWNLDTNHAAGQFAVNYGRPVWKKAYEDPANFDKMTKGKVWRMGSNFWTELDTCLPLEISGRKVTAGLYYLGLRRSEDGSKWSLAFIDPAKVRAGHIDAFDINMAPISFEVPATFKQVATPAAEKLTIRMIYTKEDIRHVTMKLVWGNMEVTVPIVATVTP